MKTNELKNGFFFVKRLLYVSGRKFLLYPWSGRFLIVDIMHGNVASQVISPAVHRSIADGTIETSRRDLSLLIPENHRKL